MFLLIRIIPEVNGMIDVRIKEGKKGNKQKHGGYVSTYQQPYGKTKRIAKRRERRLDDIPDGNFYKKLFGPLELS